MKIPKELLLKIVEVTPGYSLRDMGLGDVAIIFNNIQYTYIKANIENVEINVLVELLIYHTCDELRLCVDIGINRDKWMCGYWDSEVWVSRWCDTPIQARIEALKEVL